MPARLRAFDTETHLITPAMLAPPLVCLSHATETDPPGLHTKQDAAAIFGAFLRDPSEILIGHNAAFDLGVLCASDPSLIPLVFEALAAGRIKDTKIREQLINLSRGCLTFDAVRKRRSKYSLAQLVADHLGIDISDTKTGDAWRLRYAELDGVPLEDWPPAAVKYAKDDAALTLAVYKSQNNGGPVTNENEQTAAAFGLHLMTLRGIRIDADAVDALAESLIPRVEALREKLRGAGILRPNGKRNLTKLRERVAEAYAKKGTPPPTTDKGSISTNRETLTESGDPLLEEIGNESNAEKLLNTYVPALRVPCVHPQYSVLMESGRTSSRRPNIQNIPRARGVRESFTPRPGYVFVSCDYSTLELCALAQICRDLFGRSSMGDAINAGQDLHLAVAAEILGISYSEAETRKAAEDPEVKNARQLSKICNFGYGGGMGSASFVSFAKSSGVVITEEKAEDLRSAWFRRWGEMREYFQHINTLGGYTESYTVKQHRSGRIRRGASFTAAANSFFQGLAADGCKKMIVDLQRECYTDPASPLWGSYPVAFVHDEVIAELPDDPEIWRPAVARLSEIMIESMRAFIPDIRITTSAAVMDRWYKNAEPVLNAAGELEKWTP